MAPPTINPINGREHETSFVLNGTVDVPDDLQYACIFPLPEPRDCTTVDPNVDACACFEGDNDRLPCEERPGASPAGTLQFWGKAYPSTRQLEALRGLGESGLVISICDHHPSDLTASDYPYRPALAALVDAMEARLVSP